MCGIVGYVGPRDAVPLLVEGLRRLEYRGYDSAGVALQDNGTLAIRRSVGRLAALEANLAQNPVQGTTGIGHTRWATHGEPSEINSHPHVENTSGIAVVHNGIIENYQELRSLLEDAGHTFSSETDTEVIPHLIAHELQHGAKDFEDAIRRALAQAKGAYALGIVTRAEPGTVYAARHGSPLIVGIGKGEMYIASDVPAIINRINQVIYLNDGEMAKLSASDVVITTVTGKPVEPEIKDVTISAESAERAGFETFMLKEMHEQPRVLRAILEDHTDDDGNLTLSAFPLSDEQMEDVDRVMIIACGTAFYAGMYGKLLLEHLSDIAVEVDLASEFRYRDPKIHNNTLIVAVSQSGETADTLASVRMAKERGCKVLSICNVPGSTLDRESDAVFFTNAGPEIGVASTKAYTAQLTSFALLALFIARTRGDLAEKDIRIHLRDLAEVPDAIHYVLDRAEHIKVIAEKHHDGPSALYLGRKFNYPTALEGALKNKEISYQHAEGYAAGEMKHGPIALINKYLPVICICTQTDDEVYQKMVSNMREVDARHGRIIAIATDGDENMADVAEDVIYVPAIKDAFSPIVNVVALQLLAYYAAQARGTDIDKPRNLAKSVTVE